MTAPDLPGGGHAEPDPAAVGRVEQALAALADAADQPPQEQVEPLARAQAVLAETLDSVGDI